MSPTPTAISGKAISRGPRKSTTPRGCLIVFFALWTILGGILFYALFLQPFVALQQSRSWVETPCSIVASSVDSRNDSDDTTYFAAIRYRYEYGGAAYQSSRVRFFEVSSEDRRPAEQLVAQFPAGLATACYVNPNRPAESVLLHESNAVALPHFFSVIFVLVGIGGLALTWRHGRAVRRAATADSVRDQFPRPGETLVTRAERERLTAGARNRDAELRDLPVRDTQLDDHDDDAEDDDDDDADEEEEDDDDEFEDDFDQSSYIDFYAAPGPMTLQPESTPGKMFLILLGVALFWNGIVSVFVFQAVMSFVNGRPEWFLSLFITPFVVIGLVLIVGSIHLFLSLFNPRPEVTLLNGDLSLGDPLEVRWQFHGNTGSVRQLKIELKGSEKATYRRGTSTHTDVEVFARIPVVTTTSPHEMRAGTGRITIPRETMHSFNGSNNSVSWALRIHGTIAFWPDVDIEFPLSLRPAPPT